MGGLGLCIQVSGLGFGAWVEQKEHVDLLSGWSGGSGLGVGVGGLIWARLFLWAKAEVGGVQSLKHTRAAACLDTWASDMAKSVYYWDMQYAGMVRRQS